MEHVKISVRLEQNNKNEENCYMYLDMVKIDEKVMESCWYSLCVYKKKKKKKRDTKLHCEKRRNEKLKKKMQTKEVHNEVSSRQD